MSSLSTKQETKKSDFLTIGILVVDDEVMQAKITMHCLAEAGYSNVICVHSGRDALQILQETREMVQLVLIDVGMPEMDGYALLKAIRSMVSDGPDIPVIMLSSTEDLNIVYSCLVSGADDYMLKPVQPEFVKNIWSKVWKRRMEKQKLAEIDAEREKMVSTVSRLETEVEQLRDRVNEAIETPIHVIIRTLNDIIENKSLTNEVKDALSSIITKLGSSNLYKPAFARILDDSDDDETTTTPTKVVSIPDAASSTTDDPVQTTSNSSSSSNLSALPTDVGARKRQIALQTQAWLRAEISKSISSSYGDLPGASYINFSNTDPTVLSQHDRSGSDGASLIHAAAKGGYAYSLVDNVAEYVPCRSHSDPVLAKNIPSSSSSSSSSSETTSKVAASSSDAAASGIGRVGSTRMSITYGAIWQKSVRLLRLRFAFLKAFNQWLSSGLGLINLSRVLDEGSLSSEISKIRQAILYETKIGFCYDMIEQTACTSGEEPPLVTIKTALLPTKSLQQQQQGEKAKEANIVTPEQLQHTAFNVAFEKLKHIDAQQLRQKKPLGSDPHVCIRIEFPDTRAAGEGGPYRQFFTDVVEELLRVLPLLIPVPNAFAASASGTQAHKYIVAPGRTSISDLEKYRFFGRLMGIAIRSRVFMALDLPNTFWKPLVGAQLTTADLKAVDQTFVQLLDKLKDPELGGEEWERIGSALATGGPKLSDGTQIPLDVLPVTPRSDRLGYASLLESLRVCESSVQLEMIRAGIADVIPAPLLHLFTPQELNWRVCGKPFVDLELLSRFTEYEAPWKKSSQTIQWFWKCLNSMSQEDRMRFVRFGYGQDRLPLDDEEFKRKRDRMLIKYAPDKPDSYPRADTCFFNIHLPRYSSYEMLETRLIGAITLAAGMEDEDAEGSSPLPVSSTRVSHVSAPTRGMGASQMYALMRGLVDQSMVHQDY